MWRLLAISALILFGAQASGQSISSSSPTIPVPISTSNGGLGANNGSATGVPVLSAGTSTIASVTGSGSVSLNNSPNFLNNVGISGSNPELGVGTTSAATFGALAVRASVPINSINTSASFSDNENSTLDIRHLSGIDDLNGQNNAITLSTNPSTSNGIERFEIDSSGNVGVGCNSGASNCVLGSPSLPTITSGFGTSPTAPSSSTSNGTWAFEITIGSGGIAATGVVAMPAASHGWNCNGYDKTTISAAVSSTRVTADTSTSVTLGNYTDLSVSGPWTAGDKLEFSCIGR